MLIDCHVHCRLHKGFSGREHSYVTPDELIASLDAAGIDKAVVLGRMSPECGYCYVTPEDTAAIRDLYPDRIIPFANLDPRMLGNSPASDFRPFLRYCVGLGCKGIGEYCAVLPFDDPLNMNVFQAVEDVGLPLTFHISTRLTAIYGVYDDLGLPRLEKVLQAFPKLVFLAHSQAFWSEISADVDERKRGTYPAGKVTPGRVVELMRKYPNLRGDLSAGSGLNAITRDPEFGLRFLEEFQDRLLFGTDIVYTGQDLPIVGFFRKLREERLIAPEAYEKIAWKNAAALFGLNA